MNKKLSAVLSCVIVLGILTGCAGAEQEAKTISNIIEHEIHKGEFLGEVPVYVIDFINETYEYKSFHPIYKQSEGSYTIDYLGEEYVLSRLDNPIVLPGCEYTKVKWKFNFDCFIKDIPDL